jgi:glycogen(starch) synthase
VKTLHLSSEYPPAKVYGLGRFVHGLARAQAAQGDEVFVLTNSTGGAEDDIVKEGVRLHRIAFPNPPRPADGQGEVLQFNHGLISRFLDRRSVFESVDVVVSHDWLTAIAAREIARELKKPLVVTFHDEAVGKHFGLLDREARFVRDLEALTAHDATRVIANSRFVAEQLVRHYGVPASRVDAIHGGIDPALLTVSDEKRIADFRSIVAEPDDVLVAYVGRLDQEKGLPVLAEAMTGAFDRCPKLKLAIAGTGKEEGALRAALGARARFLGYVKGESLAYLYRSADIVVVPSLYEPFGLVALEAMVAGAAVVVAGSGGLREIVRDEEDGVVVAPGDAQALSDAIVRLGEDRELRAKLSTNARQRALTEFSWSEIARRTTPVYEAAIREQRSACEVTPELPEPPRVSLIVASENGKGIAGRTHYRSLEILDATDGVDRALSRASGDYVCVLADETLVPSGSESWLTGLVWLLETIPGAATAAPQLVRRDGKTLPVVSAPRRAGWSQLACLLARRRLFEEAAGPFEEQDGRPATREVRSWLTRVAERGNGHWLHPARILDVAGESLPATIAVVAYGQLGYTREALESVVAHAPPPYELVLVDNGSRDGVRDYFHALRDRVEGLIAVQVIENAENLGYPRAANQAIRAARGKHVVLLNNDARVKPGWLGPLLESANEEGVGAVTAKILNEDGTVQNAGGILHHPDGSFTIPHQGEDRLAPVVAERREVENVAGPCLLITRKLIEEVGMFDEAYSPAYFEDSDLCLRAREKRLKLLYEARSEVIHRGKATADAVAREGRVDLWGKFEANKKRFHERWREQLERDEDARRRAADAAKLPRKRILLCANKDPISTAAYCERALRSQHDVVTAGRGQEIDLRRPATVRELAGKAGALDLVLVVESDNYVPLDLEDAPCPTAWWAIDNHLNANPGGWHFELARRFDRVFCAQRDFVPAFRAQGAEACWLPLACDPDVHCQPAHERDLDVVFVGHVRPFHRRRRTLLDRLKRRFRVEERHGVYLEDMATLFARAKIVFNCSLAGDLNMRVFEGLASGALVVTDRIANGLETLFADGAHLLLYDDGSLEDIVARAVSDRTLQEVIGRRAQKLAVRHHTYAHRMRELVSLASLVRPKRKALAK